MSGIYFYWLSWISWTVITFLFKKNKKRTQMSVLMLLAIMFSHTYFSLFHSSINVSLLLILLFCYCQLAKQRLSGLLFHVFACNVVTIAYTAVNMFILYDPILVWTGKINIIMTVVFLFVQFMVKSFQQRLLVTVIGLCHGNMIYGIFIKQYIDSSIIGSPSFFDMTAICLGAICGWKVLKESIQVMNDYFQRALNAKRNYGK